MSTLQTVLTRWLATGMLALGAGSASALSWDSSLDAGFDDNLNNAPMASQRLSSTEWALAVSARRDAGRGLRAGGWQSLRVEGLSRPQHSGLSSLQGAVELGLWRQLGTGFTAPGLTLSLEAHVREFASQDRDRTGIEGRVALNQRWTTRLSAGAELRAGRNHARAAVFDSKQFRLDGHLDWRLSDRLLLYTAYGFGSGDVVSSVRPPNAGLVAAAQRIEPDDALPGHNAYRFSADRHTLTLGLNLALAADTALDCALRHSSIAAGAGASYQRTQWRCGVLLAY